MYPWILMYLEDKYLSFCRYIIIFFETRMPKFKTKMKYRNKLGNQETFNVLLDLYSVLRKKCDKKFQFPSLT